VKDTDWLKIGVANSRNSIKPFLYNTKCYPTESTCIRNRNCIYLTLHREKKLPRRDRQADRQTDKTETDRQTDRQADRQTLYRSAFKTAQNKISVSSVAHLPETRGKRSLREEGGRNASFIDERPSDRWLALQLNSDPVALGRRYLELT
jgi:hypothetical protein